MNKVYACTDLHGCYKLWTQIKEFCDETDTIYFLGDACDRGEHGLRIMREMLADPRVHYIKGNHEAFFEDIGSELIEGRTSQIPLWRSNGGFDTMRDLLALPEEAQETYIRRIAKLPISAKYVNKKGQTILLSHAGFTPDRKPNRIRDYLWDRNHFYDFWPTDKKYEDTYIVHGHTPVESLLHIMGPQKFFTRDKYGWLNPVFYEGGHKIDLDLASFESGKAVLLDLDELTIAATFYDKEIWRLVD